MTTDIEREIRERVALHLEYQEPGDPLLVAQDRRALLRLLDKAREDREALLRENEALRKDATRWRYFRDECDDGDKLHMIAAGTAHYDTTIDALAAKEDKS